jgi:thiamine pyrophosphate-dependent acetolactate synthase large subunit-like protein
VSGELALKQLNGFIDRQSLDNKQYSAEFESRRARYTKWRANLKSLESPSSEGIVTVPYLASRLREELPQDTIFVMEAVTNAGHLIHHLNLTKVIQPVHSVKIIF